MRIQSLLTSAATRNEFADGRRGASAYCPPNWEGKPAGLPSGAANEPDGCHSDWAGRRRRPGRSALPGAVRGCAPGEEECVFAIDARALMGDPFLGRVFKIHFRRAAVSVGPAAAQVQLVKLPNWRGCCGWSSTPPRSIRNLKTRHKTKQYESMAIQRLRSTGRFEPKGSSKTGAAQG
jgi:hypothetical protein